MFRVPARILQRLSFHKWLTCLLLVCGLSAAGYGPMTPSFGAALLPATSTVDITVQEGSTPIAGAFVALIGSGSTTARYGAVSNASGVAQFTGVVDGTFDLRAQAGGRAVVTSTITVPTALTATLTMTASTSALSGLGAYGSQTGTIVADGQSGVFYLNTTAIPSLYRTTDFAANWTAVTLSSDDPTNGIDASTTAGSPTTSGRAGEIAAVVGNKVWYSFDYGLTWASMAAPTGVPNAQMYWAHVADTASTVSQLFLTSTSVTEVYVADMTAATPSMSAMASSYKTNAQDLVAVFNGGAQPIIAVFNAAPLGTGSGDTKFWVVDSDPDSTDTATTISGLAPTLATDGTTPLAPTRVTLFKIGGPATGLTVNSVTGPTTVLIYSLDASGPANATISTCTSSACSPTTSTVFKNSDDTTSTTSIFANTGGTPGSVSLCSANQGAVGTPSPLGGGGSLASCWLTVNGTVLEVRGVQGINNNTGLAFDAAYDGTTNSVIVSGDGQHGATKSARFTSGSETSFGVNRPYFPPFPTLASSGSGTSSGGVAVQGLNAAVVRHTVFQPASATNLALVMSGSGGGRTIGSTDGGSTWFTLVDRGGNRLDWWNGATSGTQWIMTGAGGAGQWLYGAKLASASDFTDASTIASVVNSSAQAVGPTDFGFASPIIQVPGVNGVKGIPGTDYVALGSYDGRSMVIDVALLTVPSSAVQLGSPSHLITITPTTTPNGSHAGRVRMAFCPSSGSASSVADKLYVATSAFDSGATEKGMLFTVDGLGTEAAASTPSFAGLLKTDLTASAIPAGSDLTDISIDCAAGVIWLTRLTSSGGGTPSSGILKSTDGGVTFSEVSVGSGTVASALSNVVAIDFDKTTTSTVVAVSRSGDIGLTVDSGSTWTLINDTTQAACIGQTTQCGRGFGGEEPGSFSMPPATSSRPSAREGAPTAAAATPSRSGLLGSGAGLFRVDLTASSSSSTLSLSPSSLRFAATKNGAAGAITSVTAAQAVSVSFSSGAPGWTVSADQPWIQLSSTSGTGTGAFSVSVVDSGNAIGGATSLSATLTFTSAGASNSPQTIAVVLTVDQSNGASTTVPFGAIDTPAEGATGLTGALAITGWALDDVGVDRVEIWRNCVAPVDTSRPGVCRNATPGGAADQVYIGNANFLPGARTDVEGQNPTVPQAYRAGWGYLLLTNALPNLTTNATEGGQGAFVLSAYAVDTEGRYTLLGTRSVTLDNDNATQPFGAIDTPEQGGTVTGALTANFGWAMTRRQNALGVDVPKCVERSRYRVYIDGVARTLTPGTNWFQNLSRADLTAAYPGLCDSADSLNAYYIDVTALGLANGLHTIGWDVYDNNGTAGTQADDNVAGIGSRFFNLLVPTSDAPVTGARLSDAQSVDALTARPANRGDALMITSLPRTADRLVRVRVGAVESVAVAVTPDASGVRRIHLPAGQRVAVDLGGDVSWGYQVVGEQLRDLPVGSTLDPARGQFYWEPTVAHFGTYQLAFLTTTDGAQTRTDVEVTITDPTVGGEPEVTITSPRAGANPNPIVTVSGTARDPQAVSGTGVEAVHVWAKRVDTGDDATPFFLGQAQRGVAGLQEDGYRLVTPPLAAGSYEIQVFAWVARLGTWAPAATVTIAVR